MNKDPFAAFMVTVSQRLQSRLKSSGFAPDASSTKGGGFYPGKAKHGKTIYDMRYFCFWYKNRPYWKEFYCHIEASLCLQSFQQHAGDMFVSLSCNTNSKKYCVNSFPKVEKYFNSLPNKNGFQIFDYPGPGAPKDRCIYKYVPVGGLSKAQTKNTYVFNPAEIAAVVDALAWLFSNPAKLI